MKFRKSCEEDGEREVRIFSSLSEAVDSTICPKDEDPLYHSLFVP